VGVFVNHCSAEDDSVAEGNLGVVEKAVIFPADLGLVCDHIRCTGRGAARGIHNIGALIRLMENWLCQVIAERK
jgi:hypothetical protein